MTGLPTRAPVDLEKRPHAQQWMINQLWAKQAVGIIGGEPKCGKSFLALDIAVAVDTLDIAVIDVDTLRLDEPGDRRALRDTVKDIAPRLLILDPLVRLHGVDENAVAEIAPILGFLRNLQRRFDVAVVLVHHARKSGATRPGQALRGSSELHAWGDSNLSLRRRHQQIVMTVEHRAASGLDDLVIELADDGKGTALRLQHPAPERTAAPENAHDRILKVLTKANTPLLRSEIRKRAGTRNTTVIGALNKLVHEGRVESSSAGRYRVLDAGAGETPSLNL